MLGFLQDDEPHALRAYRALERMVVTLDLLPGAVTTEGALIERVGLGRTPVREAIQRLAWEGLLEIRPRAGVAVAPLHPGDWLRILEVRRGVEVILARSAARFPTAVVEQRLRGAGNLMNAASMNLDVLAFLEADKVLDEALAMASDNPYAARLAAPAADAQPAVLVPVPGDPRARRGGRPPPGAHRGHPGRQRDGRRGPGGDADGAAYAQRRGHPALGVRIGRPAGLGNADCR